MQVESEMQVEPEMRAERTVGGVEGDLVTAARELIRVEVC